MLKAAGTAAVAATTSRGTKLVVRKTNKKGGGRDRYQSSETTKGGKG